MIRDWVLAIPYIQYWGYLIAFLAAFLETLPAAGLFIPGQTIVVIAGFLAHQQILDLWLVLVLVIFGAFFGDFLGFYLGKRYGIGLFKKYTGFVKEAAALLREHPIKTLILGRFNSFTRAFAPFAAGASQVKSGKFFIANIVGALLWAGTWVLLGFILGASYEIASKWIDIIMISLIVVASLAFFGYRYLKRKQLLSKRVTWLLIANVCSLAVFVFVLENLRSFSIVERIDALVNAAMPGVWNSILSFVMIFFTSIIEPVVIFSFTACMTLLLLWHKDRKHAILFAVSMVGAAIIDTLIKALVMRPRPVDGLLAIDTYSFPSGHAFLAVVFFGGAILTYTKWIPWKRGFITTATIVAVLIALSRVYLGVHWLSDVIAGFFLGVFWLTFCFLAYEAVLLTRANRQSKLQQK